MSDHASARSHEEGKGTHIPQLSGIGVALSLDNAAGSPCDLSTDIFDFSGNTKRGQWDITALGDVGMRRLLLLADCDFQVQGIINTEANHTYDVFSTIPSDASDVLRSLVLDLPPNTTGAPEFTDEMSLHTFSPKRQQNGQMGFSANLNTGSGAAPAWGTKS